MEYRLVKRERLLLLVFPPALLLLNHEQLRGPPTTQCSQNETTWIVGDLRKRASSNITSVHAETPTIANQSYLPKRHWISNEKALGAQYEFNNLNSIIVQFNFHR